MRKHDVDERLRRILQVIIILAACPQLAIGQCNGTALVYVATEFYQVFTSVNYPFGYSNDQNCIWRIEAGNVTDAVRIEVTDAGIEYHADCVYDYGEVFDGYNATADSIGKFCGTDNPSYVSTSNYLTVTFHSDYSLSAKGFKARYKSGPRSSLLDKEEEHSQVSMLAILGASVGGIVFVVVVTTLVYSYIQAKKAKELRRHPHLRRGIGSARVEPFGYGDGWSYLDGPAPPAYGEIYSSPMSPPPQYSEIDPNPNPTAPLPGRREFMADSDAGDYQVANNAERRQEGERTDTNANTHFVITSSLRGFVTQINNYTRSIRTQSQRSTRLVRSNTVQTLNPLSLHSNQNEAGIIITSASTPNQTRSLPNAVAPLATESSVGHAAVTNNLNDSQNRTLQISSPQTDSVNSILNNSVNVPTLEHTAVRTNVPDRVDTCSTVSEMSLPSTRSVSLTSDTLLAEPIRVVG